MCARDGILYAKRCDMRQHARAWPESINGAGQVVLGHSQLALLHGLYDRPNGHAISIADWVRAASPYADFFRVERNDDALRQAALRVPPKWVEQRQVGRRISATLLPRGREIRALTIPAYVHGHGEYRGLRALRRQDQIHRPRLPAAHLILLAGPQGPAIRTLVRAWRRSWRTAGFSARLERAAAVHALTCFICDYFLRHSVVPTGRHRIQGAYSLEPMTVDYDELARDSQ